MVDSIAIIGGTGSLGSQLSRFYYNNGWKVSILSKDTHRQRALMEELPKARFVLGDVCDYDAVSKVCRGAEFVVHTAALKHVDMGEMHVDEYVRVNIGGAQVVSDVCENSDSIINALFISSDKAVSPINLYGKTKAVGEDVFLKSGFSVLRYGNVVNSRGAFTEHWQKQMISGGSVEVRKPYPTRFFLSLKDAVALVNRSIHFLISGVYVPVGLKAFGIPDVVTAFGIKNVVYSKLMPGEKQHEILVAEQEQGEEIPMHDATLPRMAVIHKGYDGMLRRADFHSGLAEQMSYFEIRDKFSELGLLREVELA